MPNHDVELDLLSADTLSVLGTLTLRVTRPASGAYDPATRSRSGTATTQTVSGVLRGTLASRPAGPAPGAGRVQAAVYVVRMAALDWVPAPGDMLDEMDGDTPAETAARLTVTAVDREIDGRHLRVHAERTSG